MLQNPPRLRLSTLGEPASGSRPTRVRWQIIGLLAVISGLTYLDRLNLSIAGRYIVEEFALNREQMGWILSAFVLGYALFQVPGGWMGDRFGPRGVLTAAILWWSVFTAATAIAPRLPFARWFGLVWSFAIARFLIGVGEAAAFPNSNKMVANWTGPGQRGIGNALFLWGVGAGGAVTPLFIAMLMQRWGWRSSFYACAAIGIVVALLWRILATNRPQEHPRVNAAELALIETSESCGTTNSPAAQALQEGAPWGRILTSASVWGLILSYPCIVYPAYIFYTWFFMYLGEARGLTVQQGGLWGSTPFLAIVVLLPLGGWASDRFAARLGKRRGRKCAVWLGATLSAMLLWIGGHSANTTGAILLLAAAAGFNLFATASWWATCNDLTREHSGSLSGLMNMFGNLGGWLSPIVTAYLATHFGWVRALDFAGLVTLASAAIYILVDAGQSLDRRSP